MPSTVNNTARAMMGALKRWRDQSQPTVTATGSGNAQIITYPVAPAALAGGDTFAFFALANTGPATLQVNAQAAKPVMTSLGTALIGGEMPAGAAVMVVYDGTNFRMLAAPTPLSISNGGTGQTTPGAAADAIGAVKDTGDTMTGPLTVPYIVYSASPSHSFSFGWDGTNTHVYVDGTDTGVIGDISSVSAGNGLSGGGTSGALSLAMSGSYSGTFTATLDLNANRNLSVAGTGYVGGVLTANSHISAAGQVSGNTVAGNYVTSNGDLHSNVDVTCGRDVYAQSGHVYTNLVLPNGDNQGGVGTSGRAFQAMFSYNYVNPSDARLKTDIAAVTECLPLVEAIAPRTYRYREQPDATRHWGFVAQEVKTAMRAANREFGGHQIDPETGQEGLAYHQLIPILWGALQELSARVKQLEGG